VATYAVHRVLRDCYRLNRLAPKGGTDASTSSRPCLSAPQVGADLLLDGPSDLVDLLQSVDTLINLPWISHDVLRAGMLLSLHQEEVGIISRHHKGDGKPAIVGMLVESTAP
jgi:hypothetical protein